MAQQIDIRFDKGIRRAPSLPASSGELSECVNLIPANGELSNVPSPVECGIKLPSNAQLLCVHHVSGEDHYLYRLMAQSSEPESEEDGDDISMSSSSKTGGDTITEEDIVVEYYEDSYFDTSADINFKRYIWSSERPLTKDVPYKAGVVTLSGDSYEFEYLLPKGHNYGFLMDTYPNDDFSTRDPGYGTARTHIGLDSECSINVTCLVSGVSFSQLPSKAKTDYSEDELRSRGNIFYISSADSKTYTIDNYIGPSGVSAGSEAYSREENYFTFYNLVEMHPIGNVITCLYGESHPVNWLMWDNSKGYSILQSMPSVKLDFSLTHETMRDTSSQFLEITDTGPAGFTTQDFIVDWTSSPVNKVLLTYSEAVSLGIKTDGTWYYIKNLGAHTIRVYPYAHTDQVFTVEPGAVVTPSEGFYPVEWNKYFLSIYPTQGGDNTVHVQIGHYQATYHYGQHNYVAADNASVYEGLSGALKQMTDKAYAQHKFTEPFFVSYGLRLVGGDIVNVSPPIRMIPSSGPNPIAMANITSAVSGTYSCEIFALAAQLQMRLRSLTGDWEKWSSTIKGVVVAISTPNEIYDHAATWDGSSTKCYSYNSGDTYFTGKDGMYRNAHYNIRDLALSIMPEATHIFTIKELSAEGRKTDALNDVATRAIIKEYTISELTRMDGSWQDIHLPENIKKATDLGVLEQISKNVTALSFQDVYANHGISYNRRSIIADVSKKYIGNSACGSPQSFWDAEYKSRVIVYVSIDKKETAIDSGIVPCYTLFNWFFFPSSNARSFVLYRDHNGVYSKKTGTLTVHGTLEGAYYIADDLDELSGFQPCTREEMYQDLSGLPAASEHNAIYASETANPFVFNLSESYAVGNGTIKALSIAGKAMSSGTSFGQFPLYAFCTDGVWPLAVNSSGGLEAPNPATPDVLTNADSVASMDGSIVFATEEGLKVVEGETTSLVTDALRGHNVDETQFNSNMPSELKHLFIADTESVVQMVAKCFCVPDYANSLLHVYPKEPAKSGEYAKHYVFSLKSKEWSTVVDRHSDIVSVVPGYPYYIIQQRDGTLIQFAAHEEDEYKDGVILTRPLCFDTPHVMKVLHDLRMLYDRHDDAKCAIQVFASNDCETWTPLNSLRKRSFKWYRLRIRTHLIDTDALSSLSLILEERRTNKLR